MTTCSATTRGGRPCRVPPLAGDTMCGAHSQSPAAVEARQAARSKGGRARARVKAERRLAKAQAAPGTSQALAEAGPRLRWDPKKLTSGKGLAELMAGVAAGVTDGRLTPAAGKTLTGVLALAVELGKIAANEASRQLLEHKMEMDRAKRAAGGWR